MGNNNFANNFVEFEKIDVNVKEIEEMTSTADKIVAGAVAAATATGAIPIPFADMPILIGEQAAMFVAVGTCFKIKIGKNLAKSLVLSALGIAGISFIGRAIATNLIKFIPGVGTVTGGAISAATAGAMTFALGRAFIALCREVKKGNIKESDIGKRVGKEYINKMFIRNK
jgi:uncharacterized protein (DUF697 family)